MGSDIKVPRSKSSAIIKLHTGDVNCKSGKFYENFIFANSVKRHICDVKNLGPGNDLPT